MTWSTFILMLAYSSAAYDQPSQRRLNTYYHASFYNCYYGSFLCKLSESAGMVAKIFVTSSDWEALNNRSVIYIQSPIAPSEDRKIECLTSLIWSPGGNSVEWAEAMGVVQSWDAKSQARVTALWREILYHGTGGMLSHNFMSRIATTLHL